MRRTIATVLILVLCAMMLISCNGREKADLSTVDSLDDLNGMIIAAQTGTFHLDALTAQTTGVDVREYPDFDQLLVALKSGAIDGYVAEEPTAYSITSQQQDFAFVPLKNNDNGFTASAADTGIAVAFKTGSSYVASVNTVLAGISAETRSALMGQMVTASANPDEALAESLVLVSSNTNTANGTLKVAMECAYEPFNWSQQTDANGAVKINGSSLYANGFDVQVAKYIAAELGMKLEVVQAEWNPLS